MKKPKTWRDVKSLIDLIPENELDSIASFSLDGSLDNTWNIMSLWDYVEGDLMDDNGKSYQENLGFKYYLSCMTTEN